MHIAVVTEGIPNNKYGGGALTAWSLIHSLKDAGHRVSAVLLVHRDLSLGDEPAWREALVSSGVELEEIDLPDGTVPNVSLLRRKAMTLRKLLRPTLVDFNPGVVVAPKVESVLARLRPDATFAYHWVAAAAISTSESAPRLAVIGDIDHLIWYYRWKYTPVRLDFSYAALLLQVVVTRPQLPELLIDLLARFEASGSFAAHHAAWLRERGVRDCRYFHTPVVDPLGREWRQRRAAAARGPKPRILMIGHLKGIATLSGLHLFADEVLPALERELGPDGFEVRIVGRFEPPAELGRKLRRPSVALLGYVEDVDREFLGADVMLVPTPIPISLRVRILTGFAYGCCVVAHRANGLGSPEILHEQNCLLAGDGRGLAQAVLRALGDRGLRERLGGQGRAIYEANFTPAVAGARIVNALETLAEGGRGRS